MFIGRKEELKTLSKAIRQTDNATLIYGKRRIGKTTLIKEALSKTKTSSVYYECIKGSLQENVDGFVRELIRTGIIKSEISFNNLKNVFEYLNTLPQKCIVVIDEYPYLKNMADSEEVDSMFQNIIDNCLSNIHLIISGSHIGMMKDMLNEGNALYGRFLTIIRLTELNHQDASGFYPEKSAYDKVAFYSVFGGSPFINKALDKRKSLKENIVNTILNTNSQIHLYAGHLLLSDYSLKMNAERIFAVIGNGRKRYSDIENQLDAKKTGNLSKQIKNLIDLDIINRNEPINKIGDNKKCTYEINDNLLRFYFTFVYKNTSALAMLGPEAFYEQYVAPELNQFISRRFEGICRSWFSMRVKTGKLKNIRNIGTYYYDDSKNHKNGEFDVAIEYDDGYGIVEVKYYQKPMKPDDIRREIRQIKEIREIQIKTIGFVSINGFDKKESGSEYYTGEDVYCDNREKKKVVK